MTFKIQSYSFSELQLITPNFEHSAGQEVDYGDNNYEYQGRG
jgi:hypothetical protein